MKTLPSLGNDLPCTTDRLCLLSPVFSFLSSAFVGWREDELLASHVPGHTMHSLRITKTPPHIPISHLSDLTPLSIFYSLPHPHMTLSEHPPPSAYISCISSWQSIIKSIKKKDDVKKKKKQNKRQRRKRKTRQAAGQGAGRLAWYAGRLAALSTCFQAFSRLPTTMPSMPVAAVHASPKAHSWCACPPTVFTAFLAHLIFHLSSLSLFCALPFLPLAAPSISFCYAKQCVRVLMALHLLSSHAIFLHL